jgi:hypothetical protein
MAQDERGWTHQTRNAAEDDETLEKLCPSCGLERKVWTDNAGQGDTVEDQQHRRCDDPSFGVRASARLLFSGLAQRLSRAKGW